MGERLQRFRIQRLDLLNKDKEHQAFEVGQIVYVYQARGGIVETGSRKIKCNYIWPLIIFKAVGPNQFLLISLDGLIYLHLIEPYAFESRNNMDNKRKCKQFSRPEKSS